VRVFFSAYAYSVGGYIAAQTLPKLRRTLRTETTFYFNALSEHLTEQSPVRERLFAITQQQFLVTVIILYTTFFILSIYFQDFFKKTFARINII